MIADHKVSCNGEVVYTGDRSKSVPDFLADVYTFLDPNYPKFYKMDLLAKLGWLCSEFLIKDHFDKTAYREEDTGIVLTNANSSLDTDKRYFQTVSEYPSPSLFVYTLPNIVIGEICIRNKFRGENAFFVFEKFNPLFLEQYVGGLIRNGVIRNCLCGWTEVLGTNYKSALYLVREASSDRAFTAG
ncbi:MAG: 3-oxoacyl-ACP synthase, partial [Chitinophagaceae bacterium]